MHYPIFVDLQARRCVVVGGGLIAQRKVTMLLRCGAAVAVVSPEVTRTLRRYAQRVRIRHVARRFRAGDLRGAWLACAATDDQQVNLAVSREAARRRILVNVVDQPKLCSFIAPSIVQQGDLVIAISTAGGSPALSKYLRRQLSRTIGPDYRRMLTLLKGLRPLAKRRLPSYQARKRYFDQLVEGRVFKLVRRGRIAQARQEALSVLK
ncbi:MAG: bifunctional precorrin-2 dehydrogenase/sirohydrochlorin ferrochelatase [Candidatus Omnitrophica bacterium]|nr:bifunctional precorrin-2 dehydrogenase/sirohydrochlorin ferrochelatase [Candidatus Omnitrophota bacterium]